MDLAATFLHAADLSDAPQKPLDGVNLLPFLKGQRTGDPHDSLFWENNWFGPPDCAMRRGAWKILQLRTGPGGAVADQWELYDLSRDAGETRNVAALHPEVVRHMDSAYRAWRTGMTQSHTARMQPVR
jgi:arylsulfatase A-like enzyme